ncbi:TPA: hypothetical protein IBL10_006036, partial [Escherichia coli]|nr:hypothetical protein [Escherichia coli]HAM4872830.1 hypothetical protein [Escherichia coli]
KNNPGVYTASLTGTVAGTATVVPDVDGAAVGTLSTRVTLIHGVVDGDKSSFTAQPDTIQADGKAVSMLKFSAKDSNGNPVTGLTTVTFPVSGVTGTMVSQILED